MKSPCRGCQREFEDKNDPECVGCEKRMACCQALGSLASNVPDELTDYVIKGSEFRVLGSTLNPEPGTLNVTGGDMTEKQEQYKSETLVTLVTAERAVAGAERAVAVAGKVCSRPDCEHGGKPQVLDDFDLQKKTGYRQSFCKACRRRLQTTIWGKKKGAVKTGSKKEEKIPPQSPLLQRGAGGISPGQTSTPEVIIPADPPTPRGFRLREEATPRQVGATSSEVTLTIDFSGFAELLKKIQDMAGEELRTVEKQAIYILKQGVGL